MSNIFAARWPPPDICQVRTLHLLSHMCLLFKEPLHPIQCLLQRAIRNCFQKLGPCQPQKRHITLSLPDPSKRGRIPRRRHILYPPLYMCLGTHLRPRHLRSSRHLSQHNHNLPTPRVELVAVIERLVGQLLEEFIQLMNPLLQIDEETR